VVTSISSLQPRDSVEHLSQASWLVDVELIIACLEPHDGCGTARGNHKANHEPCGLYPPCERTSICPRRRLCQVLDRPAAGLAQLDPERRQLAAAVAATDPRQRYQANAEGI
jgi:hypothetical protein